MLGTYLPSDTRGVSEVIGSILVFGLVVALISLLQVQAVPNANEDVEFEHSNTVTNDIADLQVAISESVDSGRTREATVKLGAAYPPRLLFFNPPSANGRLYTTDRGSLTLRNVDSSGSAGKFFGSASTQTYSTRALEYTVTYNELENSPDRVREMAVYYESHPNTTLVKESTLIDGREITLVAIGGNLSANGVDAATVEARPLSAPAEEYSVRNGSAGPINITVPTKLSAERWNETLADEYANGASAFGTTVSGGDGFVKKTTYNETGGNFNELHVELVPNKEYTLRMAKVGFGSTDEPTPAYLVSAPDDDSHSATVEVRDRFNNPVSGVTLWANASSGQLSNATTTGTNLRVTTGPDGTASVERTGTGATTVEFSEDLDSNGTKTSLETQTTSFAGMNGPILLTNVTGSDGSNTITLDVSNEGSPREVTRIQTQYVTVVKSQDVLESVVVAGGGPVGNLSSTSVETSNITDGPNAVTAVNSEPLSSNATEGQGPIGFTADRPTVSTGASQLTLTLDDTYSLTTNGALLVEVTVFYEGGHRERYTVHLFENEA